MPVRIGLVGCGFISRIYLHNLQNVFPHTRVVAVTDVDRTRARQRADEFGVPVVCETNDELFARDDVDLVVNLTVPSQHYAVTAAALRAGKHVYTEKPLSSVLDEGADLLRLATERDLMLASAPDTFLGSGIQTARNVIDSGAIGEPFGFIAHQLWGGAESWHPEPEFLYQYGAGPLLDSGPYFVTALVHLFGTVTSVASYGVMPFAQRTIGSGPRAGTRFPVEVDTFTSAVLAFGPALTGSLTLSTDVPRSRFQDGAQHEHVIEVYGTEGVLSVPSPCFYDGALYLRTRADDEWTEVPHRFPYRTDSRGVGVADMADALLRGRPTRMDRSASFHAFEVLMRLRESAERRSTVALESATAAVPALPLGLTLGQLDLEPAGEHA